MAIGINPAAVQQAFTSDNRLGEIAAQNMALGAQLQQQQLARQQQADNEAFQYDKYIQDKYNTGTGTPFDEVINNRIRQAQTALFELQKRSNRPLSMQDRWNATSQYLADLPQRVATAKLMRTQIDDMVKNAEKEYPYLDRTALEAAAFKNAFRDEQGNIRENLDPEGFRNFLVKATTPGGGQLPYVNPGQLATYYAQEFDKLHPAQEGDRIPVAGYPGRYDVPTLRTGFEYNPATREVQLAYRNIPAGNQFVQGLPENAMGSFATPAGQVYLAQKKQELSKTDWFNKLPEDEQNAVAGYQLFSNDISPRLGKHKVRFDNAEEMMDYRQKREDRIAANQDRWFRFMSEKFGYQQDKDTNKKIEKIANTPMAQWLNIMYGGDKSASAAAPHDNMYDKDLGQIVPVIDLTGIRKSDGTEAGLLDNPNGDGSKLRIVFRPSIPGNPTLGIPRIPAKMGVIRYKKRYDGGYEMDKDISKSQEVKEDDIMKTLSKYAPQLGVNPSEWEDFYNALEQQNKK